MRKTIYAIIGMAVALASTLMGRADATAEYSVQVSADVKPSPAQITLSWPQDTISTPKNYTVYRRAPGASLGQRKPFAGINHLLHGPPRFSWRPLRISNRQTIRRLHRVWLHLLGH